MTAYWESPRFSAASVAHEKKTKHQYSHTHCYDLLQQKDLKEKGKMKMRQSTEKNKTKQVQAPSALFRGAAHSMPSPSSSKHTGEALSMGYFVLRVFTDAILC